MKKLQKLSLALFFAFVQYPLSAQVSESSLSALNETVKEVVDGKGMKFGSLGFALYDVESGDMLASNNANQTHMPASTMKTFTSGAALGILGEDYRFETTLEYDGTITANGILQGNVYIRGGGDPTLGSDRWSWGTRWQSVMENFEEALQKAGIKGIEGQIVGDAGYFDDAMTPDNWVWADIGNYYGAGACGLTVMENTYYLFFKPGEKEGDDAEFLRIEPDVPDLEFVNEMKTGKVGSGDNGWVYGAPFTSLRYLRGTVPAGKKEFDIKGSLPDPAYYAAWSFSRFLRMKGYSLSEDPSTMRRLKAKEQLKSLPRVDLHTHKSPLLGEIVYWLNKKSINLYAEHLLKACGKKKYDKGTMEDGVKAVMSWWQARGLGTGGTHMNDGSGLSRYNGITPATLAGALRISAQQDYYETFNKSLPVAGDPKDPGSLRSMCKDSKAANNLRAKSGYISRVRCYAGYVETQGGRLLSFALMANNYIQSNSAMKKDLERIMVALGNLE